VLRYRSGRGAAVPGTTAAEYFQLPREQTLIMGSRIEL
jgi:hypothetical protein